jgi:hypothetical protein
MKPLLAMLIIVLLTVPSFAQGMGGGKRHRGGDQKSEQPKKKPDDKAYKAALDRLPDRPYDPWHTVRDK